MWTHGVSCPFQLLQIAASSGSWALASDTKSFFACDKEEQQKKEKKQPRRRRTAGRFCLCINQCRQAAADGGGAIQGSAMSGQLVITLPL